MDSRRIEKTRRVVTKVVVMSAVAVATAAMLWMIGSVSSQGLAVAEHQAAGIGVAEEAGDRSGPAAAGLQSGGEDAGEDEDDRVPVQLWTLVGAAGAAGIGLLLFLVRAAMGWVKPPPPQESHH